LNTAFVAFGSNLGDRRATLRRARALLGAGNEIEVVKNSRLYESEPVGGPAGQPSYLNAVVEVQTRFTPGQLLRRCLSIEDFFGRRREVRWGARTLDLDLLSYDAKVVDGPDLTIPHPRIQERSFAAG
jgi:2-amino-4-hydroxy-6-hydroxymethyldihydropteridine diphosphokinase